MLRTVIEASSTIDGGRSNLFLGRQPILDRNQDLFAFELLFRSGTVNAARFDDHIIATAVVITNAFNELGIENVLGKFRGFINLTEALLMSDMIELLPRKKVVLEVLETVRPTPQIAARCAQLHRMGFSLALDDVVSANEAFEPLLPAVEFIKIDIKHTAPSVLSRLVDKYRARGKALLAEKVESRVQAEHCLALGFEYFQGYYFAEPVIISGKKLTTSETTLLELLGLVLTDAGQSVIEQTLKRDPGLTIKLMRLANSVASGLPRRAETLGGAIMHLGRRQLQRWLQLLLYANERRGTVFSPLLQLAATRGRFMELLAPYASGKGSEDRAFITGIMSLMDTLLNRPLAEIIASLPVPAEVQSALQQRSGALGALLALCEEVEQGDPVRVAQAIAALPDIDFKRVNLAQVEALRWANSIAEEEH